MLVNQKNQPVKIADHLTSRSHPHIFVPLRETKLPLPHKNDPMFRLDQRARIKQ